MSNANRIRCEASKHLHTSMDTYTHTHIAFIKCVENAIARMTWNSEHTPEQGAWTWPIFRMRLILKSLSQFRFVCSLLLALNAPLILYLYTLFLFALSLSLSLFLSISVLAGSCSPFFDCTKKETEQRKCSKFYWFARSGLCIQSTWA